MAFEIDHRGSGILIRLEVVVGDDAVGQQIFVSKEMFQKHNAKTHLSRKAKEVIVTLAEEAMKKIDEEINKL